MSWRLQEVWVVSKGSQPGTLGIPRGIRWRGRWVGGWGWGIHVNPWLIDVNVWQNPLQCCEVISLQLIKINEKKKGSQQRALDCFLMQCQNRVVLRYVSSSCPTLCDPMDCSPPGSSVRGIFQARILEWVAMSSSRGSSRPGAQTSLPALQVDSLSPSHQGSP